MLSVLRHCRPRECRVGCDSVTMEIPAVCYRSSVATAVASQLSAFHRQPFSTSFLRFLTLSCFLSLSISTYLTLRAVELQQWQLLRALPLRPFTPVMTTKKSTSTWEGDLYILFCHAKCRLSDLVWDLIDEDAMDDYTNEEVWGHKGTTFSQLLKLFPVIFLHLKLTGNCICRYPSDLPSTYFYLELLQWLFLFPMVIPCLCFQFLQHPPSH